MKNLTDTVVTRREHTLVTKGPYRFVRHPFYDALALSVTANALVAANWFLLVGGILTFALIVLRTRREEDRLLCASATRTGRTWHAQVAFCQRLDNQHTKGAWYAALAYTLWGFFPIYWKFLSGISALQLISHRVVWSCVVLLALVARSNEWPALWAAVRSARVLGIYTVAAIAIGVNWFIFVWAVNEGHVVQSSLGYFINPLLSVVFGVLVFRERLRRLQWVSVGLAAAGVLYLSIALGTPPLIALSLAGSFGTYGLMKKLAPLSAVQGLALETSILCPAAAVYLISAELAGTGALMHSGPVRNLLMFAAGPVTTLPLLLFAAGVRRIPLSLVGMLQYINPTMQFLIALFIYHEPFARVQLLGFGLVWAALALFAVEGYVTHRWPQLAVTDVS